MTNELFNLCLPKWPHLMIVGDDVTTDQAKDIIFRTDEFFVDVSKYSGGNNKKFNDEYRALSDIDMLLDPQEYSAWSREAFDIQKELFKRVGFVDTDYIRNEWASCPFIYGPHGFCSPEGKIFYQDNIGKYPTIEEVYNDFVKIHEAFPYIRLKASLYDAESCEWDISNLVVSFVITESGVEINTTDYGLKDEYKPQDLISETLCHIFNREENGLPIEWVYDCATIVSKHINDILRERANKEPE